MEFHCGIAKIHSIIKNPQDDDFEFHTHDICELIFLKSGNVSGIIDATTYKPTKNCLLIFRAGITHRIQIEDNTEYERYDVLFDEKLLANKIFFNLPDHVNLINLNGNNHIIDLFKKLVFW